MTVPDHDQIVHLLFHRRRVGRVHPLRPVRHLRKNVPLRHRHHRRRHLRRVRVQQVHTAPDVIVHLLQVVVKNDVLQFWESVLIVFRSLIVSVKMVNTRPLR